MAASDGVRSGGGSGFSDLAPRVLVGALLIALALAAVYLGGWAFTALATVAVAAILVEWCAMHGVSAAARVLGFGFIVAVAAATGFGRAGEALLLLAVAASLMLFVSRPATFGLLYAGLPLIAAIWLRGLDSGRDLVIWALAVVWATDISAYFAGRLIGGPRIAPAISPSKTWAGLGGGMLGAGIAAAALAELAGLGITTPQAALFGGLLAVVAQAGDFLESHLKRRAGVKDSGSLLPGHGGAMDRLDGAVPVVIVVAAAVWAAQVPA